MNPAELLQSLRAVPPIGAWAVLGSEYDPDQGEWMPDGLRPSEWHHTRAQAEASASRQDVPTWIAQVVKVEGGWSTGEAFGPYGAKAHADNPPGPLQNTPESAPLEIMDTQPVTIAEAIQELDQLLGGYDDRSREPDAFREYVEADGIQPDWPRRLKRACQLGRWELAVYLESDHMRRHVRWGLSGGGFTRPRMRTSLPDILRMFRRDVDEDAPF